MYIYIFINVYIVPNCIKLVCVCLLLLLLLLKGVRLLPMLTLFKPVYIDGLFQARILHRSISNYARKRYYLWLDSICINFIVVRGIWWVVGGGRVYNLKSLPALSLFHSVSLSLSTSRLLFIWTIVHIKKNAKVN